MIQNDYGKIVYVSRASRKEWHGMALKQWLGIRHIVRKLQTEGQEWVKEGSKLRKCMELTKNVTYMEDSEGTNSN